ncbi:MAG: glycosyltransferase family 39 protein [Planctomycetota bacterium]|nr:glycosyltransferase family 39 protein [Planctomycetota bacterium]
MSKESALRSIRAQLARLGVGPWLLLALAIGLLRFIYLDRWSMWYDEALTVADAWKGSGGRFHQVGYRAIHWVVEAMGGSIEEGSLRFLPALAGFLAIPTCYWAFLPVAGPRRMGVASALLAASSWQQYWSQNARGYTMTEWVALLGTGVFLRGLKKSNGPQTLVGLAVVGSSAFFHPHGAVLAVGMALGMGVYLVHSADRERIKQPVRWVLAGGAVALILQGPGLLAAFQNYQSGGAQGGLGSLIHLIKSTAFFLTPVIGVGLWIGGLHAIFTGQRDGQFVLAVVLGTSACLALLSFFGMTSAQYLFGLHPWMLVLAVWPLGSLQMPRGVRWAYVAVMLLPSLAQLGLYSTVRMGERPRWREAYDYVWNHRAEHDLVLGMQAGLGDFYLDPGFVDVRQPRAVGWNDRTQPHNFRRARRELRPTWFVIRPAFLDLWKREDRNELRAFLASECYLQARFPVNMEGRDLDLEIYFKPGL